MGMVAACGLTALDAVSGACVLAATGLLCIRRVAENHRFIGMQGGRAASV